MIRHIIGRFQGNLYPLLWGKFVDAVIERGKYALREQPQRAKVVWLDHICKEFVPKAAFDSKIWYCMSARSNAGLSDLEPMERDSGLLWEAATRLDLRRLNLC
jgi:hypothetical protein